MIVRPSGSVVFPEAAVKLYPNEMEAQAAVKRHASLPKISAQVLADEGRMVVFEKLREPTKPLDYILFFDQLNVLHNTDTGMVGTPLDQYIQYATREKSLPAEAKDLVARYHSQSKYFRAALTVHGDANNTNIMVHPNDNSFRWIDLSVRPEPLICQLDEAKFLFHEIRVGRVLQTCRFEPSPEQMFFMWTHFCRVWTRETPEERKKLEETFNVGR